MRAYDMRTDHHSAAAEGYGIWCKAGNRRCRGQLITLRGVGDMEGAGREHC